MAKPQRANFVLRTIDPLIQHIAKLDPRLYEALHSLSLAVFTAAGPIEAAAATGTGGGTNTFTRYIPIALDTPATSSTPGNSYWTVAPLTAWDAGHWEFVKDVNGRVYGMVRVPPSVAVVPNAAVVLSIASFAVTGVTRLQVSTAEVRDGDTTYTYNQGLLTAETAQDVGIPAYGYMRKDVTFPLTTVPTADVILLVAVDHLGAHANDTLAENTLVFNAYLKIDVTE